MDVSATPGSLAPAAASAALSPPAQGRLFRSFWMGGHEGADHVNSLGVPLDMARSNGHRQHWREDDARLLALGIRTVRESIGWRTGDNPAALARLRERAAAATDAGLQVIWTLHHYGLPPGLSFFDPDFAARFADFCDRIARALHGLSDGPNIYQPINEISFLSWAVSASNLMHPHRGQDMDPTGTRGYELKCRLVRAALHGCDALWATEPAARIVHTDPLIHLVPDADLTDEERLHWGREADVVAANQYQSWDMLCGRLEAGLGGGPRYLDVVGVNHYHSSQWEIPSHRRLRWHLSEPRRRDLADLLEGVYRRYQRPLFIAETSHVGDGRGPWLDDIAQSVLRCHARGVPVEGICLYPVVDRPDWEDTARWHRSGLWDIAPSSRVRVLNTAYAARLRHWQQRLPGVLPSSVQTVQHTKPDLSLPASQTAPRHLSRSLFHLDPETGHTMTTLIVFSHLRWDFVYQRPQQLLARLANRFRVVFVEEPVTGATHAALERQQPCEGVEVLRPHVPGNAAGFHDDHIPMLRALLADYMASRGIDDYLLWFYTPMAIPLAADLTPRTVVYDCMDELSAFHNAPRQLLQRESALFKYADLVFTGGHSLFEAKCARHEQVHCFPSSVDAEHYARPSGTDHPAQQHLPHPRLGYFGVIDERIDLGLIAALADTRPSWELVMVGPVVKIDPASLPQRPNLHWLGQRSYGELPDLIAGWDVCLLPFALNESTRYISPTKTLEYLAAGKPVVSTPIRDVVRPYGERGLVSIADSHVAFEAACAHALERGALEEALQGSLRAQLLAGTSWDNTVERMSALISALPDRRAQAPLNLPVAETIRVPEREDVAGVDAVALSAVAGMRATQPATAALRS